MERDLVSVMIHEYAHLITLNGKQVNFNRIKEKQCNGLYLSKTGCVQRRSYLNAFVEKYWDEQALNYEGDAGVHFKEREDDFITEYAATNPEEDIVESFVQFVLYGKPLGDEIKDSKVRFFYDYPELVKLRKRIREEVKPYYISVSTNAL
jgi:hypothetical protein